jgi:WD40 repeat protein
MGRGSTILLWEIDTGKVLFRSKTYLQAIFSFALSPDNKYIFAGTRDGMLYQWDISNILSKNKPDNN